MIRLFRVPFSFPLWNPLHIYFLLPTNVDECSSSSGSEQIAVDSVVIVVFVSIFISFLFLFLSWCCYISFSVSFWHSMLKTLAVHRQPASIATRNIHKSDTKATRKRNMMWNVLTLKRVYFSISNCHLFRKVFTFVHSKEYGGLAATSKVFLWIIYEVKWMKMSIVLQNWRTLLLSFSLFYFLIRSKLLTNWNVLF